MPKSFAEDGASGAYSGSASGFDAEKAAASAASTPSAPTMSDPGPSAPSTNWGAVEQQYGAQGIGIDGGPAGGPSTYTPPSSSGGGQPYGSGGDNMNYTGYTTPGNATYKQASISRSPTVYQDTTGLTKWDNQFLQGQPSETRATGWAEGGAIPDDSDGSSAPDTGDTGDGGGDTQGAPGQQDEFSQALNSVDQVMQSLYAKYGADGGSDANSSAPDPSQDGGDMAERIAGVDGHPDNSQFWGDKNGSSYAPGGGLNFNGPEPGQIDDQRNAPAPTTQQKAQWQGQGVVGGRPGQYNVTPLEDLATSYKYHTNWKNNPMSKSLGINDLSNPANLQLPQEPQGDA